MPEFAYKASTMDGKIVEGIIEAVDERNVLEKLKDTGLIPLKINLPKGKKNLDQLFKPSAKKGLLTFTTELSIMLNAGLTLDKSLVLLSNISESKGMKDIILSLIKNIRGGNSLSDALKKHSDVFPRLYINMVKAGEAGGVLENVLSKLTEFLESSSELKENIYSAMFYPVILFVTGSASIVVLLTYVLPKFSSIFEDLGQSLPTPTLILLTISNLLSSYWWVAVLTLVFAWFTFKSYLKTSEGRYNWDSIKLKYSFNVLRNLEVARFCRTLGTLLKSGVPILQALNNVKDIVENAVMASAIDRVAKGTKEGEGISQPIANTKVFPPLALSMIKLGEETGQLDEMLLRIADTYEKSLKIALKRFIGLIEPVMILFMGLIVGLIVISILMAVFSINDLPF
jgi:general secretion pathway protein F